MNVLVALLGAVVILVAVVFGLQFLYSYRVKEHAVDIMLFNVLRLYRLPFRDIELMKKVTWGELGVGGSHLRLGNRFTRQCVLIQKKSGWFRRIVITPDDPDSLISQYMAG